MAGCDPPRLVQGLVGQMVRRWRGCWGVAGVALLMGGWPDLWTW